MNRRTENSRSELTTPYGVITLTSERASFADIELMEFRTEGRLIGANGAILGNCAFDTYRRKRNKPSMEIDDIGYWMDILSQKALELYESLVQNDWFDLENYVNDSCLLIADRIEIAPEMRGRGAWKTLYFATMHKALESFKRKPAEFFFNVFPLEFEHNVTEANLDEFKRAERNLKRLYAVHLGATCVPPYEDLGSYMRAPVPIDELSALTFSANGPT